MEYNYAGGGRAAWTDVGGGLRRRVLSHTPEMMVVEIEFAAGGVGDMHAHPHAQSTIVKSGRLIYKVGSDVIEMTAGDSVTVAPNAEHGMECLEAGSLIDVFAPERAEFL